eukprot:5816444-Amphidinium_carterae.1
MVLNDNFSEYDFPKPYNQNRQHRIGNRINSKQIIFDHCFWYDGTTGQVVSPKSPEGGPNDFTCKPNVCK